MTDSFSRFRAARSAAEDAERCQALSRSPETELALQQATAREAEALSEFSGVLETFSSLVLRDKIPKGPA
jgi:hypothetical protein